MCSALTVGGILLPPTPAYRFKDVRDLGCLITSEDWAEELAEYRSLYGVG